MLNKLNSKLSDFMEQYIPSALVFSVLLSFFCLLIALIFQDSSLKQNIIWWGNGLWKLNNFAMQMSLILILGTIIAKSPKVERGIDTCLEKIKSKKNALILLVIISFVACLINWGLGLIIGGIVSIKLKQKFPDLNFPLMLAISYGSFLVWHGGISGSIPLKLTEESIFITRYFEGNPIPLTQSIGSYLNFILISFTFVLLLSFALIFNIKDSKTAITLPDNIQDKVNYELGEDSKILKYLLVVLILSYLLLSNIIGINFVITLFLLLSLLCYENLGSFFNKFKKSLYIASGIILLFPFYSGIMSVMNESGLGIKLSQYFMSISTKESFLMNTFLSAGIINFFVPSGGGQWIIQAPVILPAAKKLGVDPVMSAMAIAWGDAWSNMIQPFWAIPILSLTGARLKDLMKYLWLIFAISGIFYLSVFYLVSKFS